MSQPRKIILASGSAVRLSLLRNAGVEVLSIPSGVDERAEEETLRAGMAASTGLRAETLAAHLAARKAEDVGAREVDALVIGADQVLEFDGALLSKPSDRDEARRRLIKMAGADHRLVTATVIWRDGAVIWRNVSAPKVRMRRATADEIDAYLATAGAAATRSVACYEVEGLGARLIERIEGDFFSVLGLPLFPLLAALRQLEAIEF